MDADLVRLQSLAKSPKRGVKVGQGGVFFS